MSASKHTPGPWVAGVGDWNVDQPNATDTGSTHWKHITDDNDNVIALVVEASWSMRASSSFEANARLIAAAPDLLDALQGLLSRADEHLLAYVALTERDAARAAIAKATGAA